MQDSFYLSQESISKEEKKRIDKEKKKYNETLLNGAFNAKGDVKGLKLPTTRTMSEDLTPLGLLYVPKINGEMLIYAGTSDEVLASGVGIIKNTSMPGGMGSHSVISGHRGTHNAELFRHLDKLHQGDEFYVIFNKDLMKYVVRDVKIVQPEEASVLNVYPDKDLVTLLTCTPYLINTERLLVEGERKSVEERDRAYFADKFSIERIRGKEKEEFKDIKSYGEKIKEAEFKTRLFIGILGGILFINFIIILPLIGWRKKERERKVH